MIDSYMADIKLFNTWKKRVIEVWAEKNVKSQLFRKNCKKVKIEFLNIFR